jgi:hypothetical protein
MCFFLILVYNITLTTSEVPFKSKLNDLQVKLQFILMMLCLLLHLFNIFVLFQLINPAETFGDIVIDYP